MSETSNSTVDSLNDSIFRLRAAGLSVIPINHRDKRPANRLLPKDDDGKPVWKPFQAAIADETTVTQWCEAKIKAFAVVAGAVSGGLLILDFDIERLYFTWRDEVGDLARDLPVQRTGGGYQAFLRCPAPGENAKLAWVESETEESGRTIAIETRGEGGYAVVAPSIHPTGTSYAMVVGDLGDIPTLSQAHADALCAAARKLCEAPYTKREREKLERQAAVAHQRRVAAQRNGSASVIDEFNNAHDITTILERAGYTPLGDRFIRPGGNSPSVSVRDGRSCHFSTNDPLNDGQVRDGIGVHDAFDVFVHTAHGGDVRAGVKAAARLLGIQPSAPTGGRVEADGPWQPKPEQIIPFTEPMRLAEHYIKYRRRRGGELTMRRYREQWWIFENGGYRHHPDEVVLADVYRHVDTLWTPKRDKEGEETGEYVKVVARSSNCSELAKAIPACGAIVDGEMPQWLDGRIRPLPRDVVAFRNGLLDTSTLAAGQTDLLPLTPLWFSGVACPFNFDPQATCPHWLEFLNQIFDGDQESVALLQEWFGLNLVPDNQYERLMLLVGPPRAGKGTVLEVLGAMLGDNQAATTSFTKLASRFGLAPLVGQLAAILPDAHISSHTDAKSALEVLKSITGNDPQAIDRKGIDELPRVRLFTRFTIAVNELPKLPDEAGAIKTRLLLLHFRNSYADRQDPTLKPRLRAEAAGVAVWALEGLKRLRALSRFTVPQRSAAMIDAFEKIVSPVLGFIEDCCELAAAGDTTVWVEKEKLFDAWAQWSRDRGDDPGSKSDLGQALVNTGKGIVAAKRGPRGQQFPVYMGVRLCS